MKVGICSVGTELVTGEVADTNAAWLARRVLEAGGDVGLHLAVGDDHRLLVEGLRWLAERCDAAVVGGGLGPTPDDLTRVAVAEVAGVPLERRDDLVAAISARFASRGLEMPLSNLRQAEVPAGATVFEPVGTAPGFAVEMRRGGAPACVIYALPGVPFELRAMVERDVLPDLQRRGGRAAAVTRTVRLAGMGESQVAATLEDVVAPGVRLAFLAGGGEVQVKVSASALTPADARAATEPVVEEIRRRLGSAVAGVDEEGLEHAVARLLKTAGLTVAVAESCTAGQVTARLAAVPGASDYLRGGLIAYTSDVKQRVLGVPGAVLDDHGPVAIETTEAMAAQARGLFSADVGLAVTCVAGPTGQGGRPVGTVVTAIAGVERSVRSRSFEFPGDRATVQTRAATILLEGLRRYLTRRANA